MNRLLTSSYLYIIPSSSAHGEPLLVVDAIPEGVELPLQFRATNDLENHKFPQGISLDGLNTLNISGSHQFSEKQFDKILEKLPKNILIIDLRQESHGFLNGSSVYFYERHNWSNRGLSDKEVMNREASQPAVLKKSKAVNLFIYHQKKGKKAIEETPDEFTLIPSVPVESIKSEKQAVEGKRKSYFRIYLTDDLKPSDENVDQFLEVWKKLKSDQWIHFHCRDGRGRTTTFMVMADILKNGRKVSLKDIIKRQAIMGLKDLNKLPHMESYKYPYAVERLKFLKHFYKYAQKHYNLTPSWSEWIKKHPPE